MCDPRIQCILAQHSKSVAVYCSVRQCVVVCYSSAFWVCCNILHCVALCNSVLQCVAVRCSAIFRMCIVLQCVAVCCGVLQPRIPKGLDEFEENLCHDSFTCGIRNVVVCLLFEIPQNKRIKKGLEKFDGHLERACNVTHMNTSCHIHEWVHVMQHVAVCCSLLQCVAVCCIMLQCVATCWTVLHHVTVCRNVL